MMKSTKGTKTSKRTVEFCHQFDPGVGNVTVPHSGGNASYPSRLTIFGAGADTLAERYHQNMSGFDHYPRTVSPDFAEITRTRNTDWDKAISLLRTIAEQAGFEFTEVTPKV